EEINSKDDGGRRLSNGSFGLFLRSVNIEINGKKARYVQVTAPKGSKVGSDLPYDTSSFLQLAEVEVFKVPDYGKPAYLIYKL
ncbi:MAG: hypothetical protein KKH98_05820, partial [Spirochaetes bacterium]|nr:hypothetical protein [Spirochaetota bacterium]